MARNTYIKTDTGWEQIASSVVETTLPSSIPYAMAAGQVALSGTAAVTQSATITFPVGRFSVAPRVSVTCSGISSLAGSAQVITATGMMVFLRQVDGATWTGPYNADWTAIQMTSSSASG